MKKFLVLPFVSLSLFAATQKVDSQKIKQVELMEKQAAATHTKKPESSPELMIISPPSRAKDLKQAYTFLKDDSKTSEVVFKLHDGKTIKGITSITIMDSGTMLIFEVSTQKGLKYTVVNVEDIDSLEPM